MKRSRALRDLEDALIAAQAGAYLYADGTDPNYLKDGFPYFYQTLEKARAELEGMGLYEKCRAALETAQMLVQKSPADASKAADLVLEANRAIISASGSYGRYQPSNDPGA